MGDVLFLTHRIPYPPDKGEKIRAWNVLQHLTARHRVHLGMFIDRREDVRHVEFLRTLCASVFWQPLSPRLALMRGLRDMVAGRSLTEGYFGDARLRAEVNATIARSKPSLYYVFSSAMAPYIPPDPTGRVIIDMVDVDSEKWRQYAKSAGWPLRPLYAREGRSLLALERRAAAAADAVSFVTPNEAQLFKHLAPEVADRVHSVGNGVDTEYFDPTAQCANPFDARPAIVFTGVMDYRPNVEAMVWFVSEVMPLLRKLPAAPCLWIVGSSPNRSVRALACKDVVVTGRVPDTRPFLRFAKVVVAPLHIARGVQNKVLEAMAMQRVVVVTPPIRGALHLCQDNELMVANTADEFAKAIDIVLAGNEASEVGARARARVLHDYRWQLALATIDRLIGDDDERQALTVDAAVRAAVVS